MADFRDIILGETSVERAARPQAFEALLGPRQPDTIRSAPPRLGDDIAQFLYGQGVTPETAQTAGNVSEFIPGIGEAGSARQLGQGLAEGDFGSIVMGAIGALGGSRIPGLKKGLSTLGSFLSERSNVFFPLNKTSITRNPSLSTAKAIAKASKGNDTGLGSVRAAQGQNDLRGFVVNEEGKNHLVVWPAWDATHHDIRRSLDITDKDMAPGLGQLVFRDTGGKFNLVDESFNDITLDKELVRSVPGLRGLLDK